jgi:polyisoprenoid-binding protein YceI
MNHKRRLLAATLMTTVASLLWAAELNITPLKSTVVATFKQEGVAVDSPFKSFSGKINYDPAKVAASTAAIDVDMGSLDIGDEAYNAEVRKKSWFDSATFPKGTFRSTAIKAGAAGKFEATGALTIKGRVLTITVPISVTSVAGNAVFDGSFVMSRKAFGIGDPIWDDVLEDKVTVKFHLVGGK